MRDSSSTLLPDDEDLSFVSGDAVLVLAVLGATVEPERPRPEVRSRLMKTLDGRRPRAA